MTSSSNTSHDSPWIILPGGTGLVGQNLALRLYERGHRNLVVLDKHAANVAVLRELLPDIEVWETDLATVGDWDGAFAGADAVVMLQAQIGALDPEPFQRNNIVATDNVLAAMRAHNVSYLVHVSSSVVESVADDLYTQTKAQQERMIEASGFNHVTLRPTLMFVWFDRKHLGGCIDRTLGVYHNSMKSFQQSGSHLASIGEIHRQRCASAGERQHARRLGITEHLQRSQK